MAEFIIAFAVIIFTCIFLNKMSSRIGVPVLLLFIVFGLLYGWAWPPISMSETKEIEQTCTIALIFIMFYGGFGTNWKSARPVVVESAILATIGVAATAAAVGFFCHLALHWGWVESFLMGSVISSTDAASVFSILRSKNLGLKNHTAPLLEIESGSNDPCSYMLTVVMLSVLQGQVSGGAIVWDVFAQLAFGAACGLVIAQLAVFALRRFNFSSGFDSLFILAVALLSYAVPSVIGGNGYLSAYIVGIVLGNVEFKGRKSLIHFFDGVTSLMQILIFFLLGFMCIPSKLGHALLPAIIIFVFLTLVARPLSIFGILIPFRKYKANQMGLISFVGLRGAASIVFAIMTLSHQELLQNDIFSIVFCIVLLSISIQGSLIPNMAKLFKMTDSNSDVMTTFSDFGENLDMSFGRIKITAKSSWNGIQIKDMRIPGEFVIVLVNRDGNNMVPNGDTILQEGDELIFCCRSYTDGQNVNLTEHNISASSRWIGKTIRDYRSKPEKSGKRNRTVVLIQRGDKNIFPKGDTVIEKDDKLIFYTNKEEENKVLE